MARKKRLIQKRTPWLDRLVPEKAQGFLARRIVDGAAVGVGGAGLFTLTSLLTYSRGDASWNTASADGSFSNWAGEPGAYIADMLWQTLGLGSFAFAVVFCVWGVRLMRRQQLYPLWARFAAMVAGALCLSMAAARIPAGEMLAHPWMGGGGGTLLYERIGAPLFSVLDWDWLRDFASVLYGLVSLVGILYAAALTRAEIDTAVKGCGRAARASAVWCIGAYHDFMDWVHHYNSEDYIKSRPVRTEERASPGQDRSVLLKEPRDTTEEAGLFGKTIPVVKSGKRAAPKGADPAVAARKPVQTRLSGFETGEWELPPHDLLQDVPEGALISHLDEAALQKNAELLQNVLADFNVQGEIVSIHPGPVVTLYELEPAPGIKTARVISLSDDIARSMSAISVRSAVVPGRNVIGIELPNSRRQTVYLRELLDSREVTKNGSKLPLILGKTIGGQPVVADLAKMPHLLVAGTTGSGKSVAVNTMILSLLYRLPPEKCRFIMIDPKMLELSVYDDIPHLLSPVVTEPGKAVVALKWTVAEMENRYRAMSKLGVRNIEGYNARLREAKKAGEVLMRKVQTGFDPDTGKPVFEDQPIDLTELPYIVVVVDEFADLMIVAGKDVEGAIQRLAQMARAAGIHLIMATQRPSVDVITGVVKANFPTRISFQVTSKIDSRTILGESGAEQLLGMGDMLYMAPGGRITRVHGPFVSDDDVENVVNWLRAQGTPDYIDDVTDGDAIGGSEVMGALFGDGEEGGGSGDDLYDQAVALVARERKASTSFIQRHLQIGYNRAARIIEEMEKQGVIGPANHVGKREVLIQDFSE